MSKIVASLAEVARKKQLTAEQQAADMALRNAQAAFDELTRIVDLLQTELPAARAKLCRAQEQVAILDFRARHLLELSQKQVEDAAILTLLTAMTKAGKP